MEILIGSESAKSTTMMKIFFTNLLVISSTLGMAQLETTISNKIGVTFGGPHSDRGVHTIKTTDNFLVTIGVTTVPEKGEDIFLIKTDLHGNKIWEKTFGGKKDDAGWDLEEIDGGNNFILSGWSDSFSEDGTQDILVVKISNEGELIWTKSFENSGDERCWSLEKLNDGQFILVGQTQEKVTRKTYGLVTKITSTGDLVWQKKFGNENYNRLFYAAVTSSEEIVLAGITRKDSLGENNGWVVRIDKDGNQQKSTRLNSIKNITTHGILQLAANKIMIIGYAQTDTSKNQRAIYLALFDKLGNLKWEKTSKEQGSENHGIGSILSSTGSIIITGYTRPLGTSKWEGVFYKFSTKGKMIRKAEFGGSGSDQPYGIVEISKNNMVVTGLTNSYGNGGTDAWLVWLDDNGIVMNNTQPSQSSKDEK